MTKNSFGGAHIDNNGLHLGHFFGSIIPLIKGASFDNSYFLLRDKHFLNHQNDIKIIASQIYALNHIYNLRIRIVNQSSLYNFYLPLFEKLLNSTTYIQVVNVHTNRKEIKNKGNPILMKDFLFPFETTISFVLLGITDVLLTGNDFPIVDFARKTIKKINFNFSENHPIPVLYYGKNDIIKGYNYKKMNTKNENCIYLKDSGEVLKKKIEKLFDYKFLFKNDELFKHHFSNNPHNYILPDLFLPTQYFYKFIQNFNEKIDFSNPKYSKTLFETLFNYFERLNSQVIRVSDELIKSNLIEEMIKSDNEFVDDLITEKFS